MKYVLPILVAWKYEKWCHSC